MKTGSACPEAKASVEVCRCVCLCRGRVCGCDQASCDCSSIRPLHALVAAGGASGSELGLDAPDHVDMPRAAALRGPQGTRVDAEAALRTSAGACAPSTHSMSSSSTGNSSSVEATSLTSMQSVVQPLCSRPSAPDSAAARSVAPEPSSQMSRVPATSPPWTIAAPLSAAPMRTDNPAALGMSAGVHTLSEGVAAGGDSYTPSRHSLGQGEVAGEHRSPSPALASSAPPGQARVDGEVAHGTSPEARMPTHGRMADRGVHAVCSGGSVHPGGAGQHPRAASSSSDTDSNSGSDDNTSVSCQANTTPVVEEDAWDQCARRLAAHLRCRPTLPACISDPTQSLTDVSVPIRLPLFSCPFKGCVFSTDDAASFDRHVASRTGKEPHHQVIAETCRQHLDLFDSKDFVHRAVSLIEQKQVPLIGPAVTRRSLRHLRLRYNDDTVKAVCCFVCGQLHTTTKGPLPPEQYGPDGAASRAQPQHTVRFVNSAWLRDVERSHPGSLLNNCSYGLWRARYEEGRYDDTDRQVAGAPHGSQCKWPKPCASAVEYDLGEWCLCLPLGEVGELGGVSPSNSILLFGVTEDVACGSQCRQPPHQERDGYPFCRVLCSHCQVPICSRCAHGLHQFTARSQQGTIPMALANDGYYGYAARLLVEKRVTWLECACASLVWSTIMVYYLEEPYGHLMLEEVEGAQARTQVRGNLFSFSLPWEDIEERCREASKNWHDTCEASQQLITLPHSEDVLAALVNVHIVGGSKDLACHLEGATMRTDVVLSLIGELCSSGYSGYTSPCNSEEAVQRRMKEMYVDKYGKGPFMPEQVREASAASFRAKLSGTSLIHDKRATPAEPAQSLIQFEATCRPFTLVAARSSASASTAHEEHANILARYQTLEVTTGSTMMDQFQPQYLGLAHPFTMPLAVGGYDVPGKPRWRRPSVERLAAEPSGSRPVLACALFKRQRQAAAATVKLEDMVSGMPRRIEAQFRRDWTYVPSLWNLYFREQVNLGASLGARSRGSKAAPQDAIEQDAAMAAADLIKKASVGFFKTQDGKRRPISGDMSKLRFAEGITPLQKRLLQDFSFRTKGIAGTQEIRSKIGHVCFWASVVYGNGIFMTISPGERHSYLAIRLSRYRAKDPYITHSSERHSQEPWIGQNRPSLQARDVDSFGFEVPGYDLRRLIQARDPLAVAQAFAIQVRCILSTVLGIRMCPNCPHCSESDAPCMDGFGSNAELVGGIAGRSDGLCGAVECQKSSGSLHLHFWNFVQRVHQHHSLAEIAAMSRPSFSSIMQF